MDSDLVSIESDLSSMEKNVKNRHLKGLRWICSLVVVITTMITTVIRREVLLKKRLLKSWVRRFQTVHT